MLGSTARSTCVKMDSLWGRHLIVFDILGKCLMHRINFTVADLAKIRVEANVDPVVETLFAVDLFVRDGGGMNFRPWRKRVGGNIGPRSRALMNLAKVIRPVPDLLAMLEHLTSEESSPGRSGRIRVKSIFSSVEAARKVMIEPFWPRLCAYVEADSGARGRMISEGGVELFLQTLQPNAQWSGSVLTLPSLRDEDVCLGGRGLVLVPSLFMFDRPCTILDRGTEVRPLTIAFPVPIDTVSATALWSTQPASDGTLGALVGRTRAAIIRSLTEECSTSELGQRLGISSAAASQHASVLRAAGLITTSRWLNKALHRLTPLGSALLAGHCGPARARPARLDTACSWPAAGPGFATGHWPMADISSITRNCDFGIKNQAVKASRYS